MQIIFNNDKTLNSDDINEFNLKVKDYQTKINNTTKVTHTISIGVGSVVNKGCTIGNNVNIQDEVVIGDGSNIGDNCVIESNVKIGKNVKISPNQTVGEDAIIEDNTTIKDTFYKKAKPHSITYCGNDKVSIGCQLYSINTWVNTLKDVAKKFKYTQEQTDNCYEHILYIKEKIK